MCRLHMDIRLRTDAGITVLQLCFYRCQQNNTYLSAPTDIYSHVRTNLTWALQPWLKKQN